MHESMPLEKGIAETVSFVKLQACFMPACREAFANQHFKTSAWQSGGTIAADAQVALILATGSWA